jgi:hypothetical protein
MAAGGTLGWKLHSASDELSFNVDVIIFFFFFLFLIPLLLLAANALCRGRLDAIRDLCRASQCLQYRFHLTQGLTQGPETLVDSH